MEDEIYIGVIRASSQSFKIYCRGHWKTITNTSIGFKEIEKAYPIMELAHALACNCK